MKPGVMIFVLLMNLLPLHGVSATEVDPVVHTQAESAIDTLQQPLYKPLVERYVLDELKALREANHELKLQLVQKMANTELSAVDRVVRYAADMTNIIFYIITVATSILLLVGWRSIRDIKDNMSSMTAQRVAELTKEYEDRLNKLEKSVKERSEQIVATQKEISDTNLLHSIWMRAGLEKSTQERIKLYDQILELNPQDVEALTYKADALLDLEEESWALSLANQAIELDVNYALAYWQSACAKTRLDQHAEALLDIQRALELSASLREELDQERHFEGLRDLEAFQALMEQPETT